MDFSEYGRPSEEWQALLRDYPTPAPKKAREETVLQLRDRTNASRERSAAQFMRDSGLKQHVSHEDYTVPTRDGQGIQVRVYRPECKAVGMSLPTYIHYHGGGYIYGSLDTEDATCAKIVSALSISVISINYRHTPGFTHPTQYNDAWDSFNWIAHHGSEIGADIERIVVGGISSGGGLASSVVLRHSQQPMGKARIIGQSLIIPWLIHRDAYPFHQLASKDISSYHQNLTAPVLPNDRLNMFMDLLEAEDPNDPYLSTGNMADELAKLLPKTAIVVAGMDPLRDESLMFAKRLERNNVPTKIHIFPGLPHGFRRYEALTSSARWDELMAHGIRWALEGSTSSSVGDPWKIEVPRKYLSSPRKETLGFSGRVISKI